jgi:hypothetical protein
MCGNNLGSSAETSLGGETNECGRLYENFKEKATRSKDELGEMKVGR